MYMEPKLNCFKLFLDLLCKQQIKLWFLLLYSYIATQAIHYIPISKNFYFWGVLFRTVSSAWLPVFRFSNFSFVFLFSLHDPVSVRVVKNFEFMVFTAPIGNKALDKLVKDTFFIFFVLFEMLSWGLIKRNSNVL